VLIAYFDASYNHPSSTRPDSPLLHTVGGYVGLAEDWRKFRKEWRGELRKKGVPDFHMNKYEKALSETIHGRELRPSDPYYGWPREDFTPFLQRLHNVLRRKNADGLPRLEGIGQSIKKADFDSMLPDELKDDPGCKSHFMFNIASNIAHVAMWATHNKYSDEIHYVFDAGDGEDGNIARFFDSLWEYEKARKWFRLTKEIASTGYELRAAQVEPSIQAADIAAYEFNKLAMHCLENNYDIDEQTARKSVVNLCREPNNNFPLLLAGDRMKDAFEAMAAFKRHHGKGFGQTILPRQRSATNQN
jgi:hypothetical protein